MGDYDHEFNLNLNRDCGQLWLDDRKMLWNTVRELKPKLAIETGTWMGGGSTYFIASALHKNGWGVLHTVEWNVDKHAHAKGMYDSAWRHLRGYVRLHCGDSVPLLTEVMKRLGDPEIDFAFIDGGEGEIAIREFDFLWPRVRVGGVIASHDFYNGKEIPRMKLLRDAGDCSLEIIGNGDGNFEKGSVGFAKAVKLR